jgi:hypothetical protein
VTINPERPVLDELEQRVTKKLTAALPKWPVPDDPLPPMDFSLVPPLADDVPQFPRERWLTYPARRARALVMADKAIDLGMLSEAGLLVQYGGKERIS